MSVDLNSMNDVDDPLAMDSDDDDDDEVEFSSNWFSLLNWREIVVDKHLDVTKGNVQNHCSMFQVISYLTMTPVMKQDNSV